MKLNKILLILAIIAISILPASAYQVPQEYKASVPNGYDHEIYYLAVNHAGEQWADYALDDLGYRYSARNLEQLQIRMAYQKTQIPVKVNRMVRVNG